MSCRSCGHPEPRTFLELGRTPLADALVHSDEEAAREESFPLDVAFCPECSLVQILEEVPPEKLFVDNYHYFSSFSDHLLGHARTHAEGLIAERGLNSDSLVVEVGSNDGYLLRNFVDAGIPVLGIDPSPGPSQAAIEAGVPTLPEFFGEDLAKQLVAEGKRADVLIANNVMAHTPTLNSFVAGIAELLTDDGVATIENPQVRDLIEHGEFDTIYHEHFSYFSCSAIDAMMQRHGLTLFRVQYFPELHGGTLRWWVHRSPDREASAIEFLENERRDGLTEFAYYEQFGNRVREIRDDLLETLRALKADGRSIAAYGAAAKGSTLLNYCGIGTDLIDFVVDRNVHKHGARMPGVHIPISPPERLVEDQPDYVLLLVWNFREEVLRQQAEYLEAGGRFIVPIPAVEIVERAGVA
jgi:SAM-dependent methyltransferase